MVDSDISVDESSDEHASQQNAFGPQSSHSPLPVHPPDLMCNSANGGPIEHATYQQDNDADNDTGEDDEEKDENDEDEEAFRNPVLQKLLTLLVKRMMNAGTPHMRHAKDLEAELHKKAVEKTRNLADTKIYYEGVANFLCRRLAKDRTDKVPNVLQKAADENRWDIVISTFGRKSANQDRQEAKREKVNGKSSKAAAGATSRRKTANGSELMMRGESASGRGKGRKSDALVVSGDGRARRHQEDGYLRGKGKVEKMYDKMKKDGVPVLHVGPVVDMEKAVGKPKIAQMGAPAATSIGTLSAYEEQRQRHRQKVDSYTAAAVNGTQAMTGPGPINGYVHSPSSQNHQLNYYGPNLRPESKKRPRQEFSERQSIQPLGSRPLVTGETRESRQTGIEFIQPLNGTGGAAEALAAQRHRERAQREAKRQQMLAHSRERFAKEAEEKRRRLTELREADRLKQAEVTRHVTFDDAQEWVRALSALGLDMFGSFRTQVTERKAAIQAVVRGHTRSQQQPMQSNAALVLPLHPKSATQTPGKGLGEAMQAVRNVEGSFSSSNMPRRPEAPAASIMASVRPPLPSAPMRLVGRTREGSRIMDASTAWR